jgi:hypothetical protein
MNAKKFSDAMSELDSKYIDEAINYKKKAKKPAWVKWGAMAACLAVVVVVGFAAWQQITVPTEENAAGSSTTTDIEPFVGYSLEEAAAIAEFGELFPTQILEDYVLDGSVGVYDGTVLQAKFYNEKLEDELVIEIAHKGWYVERHGDLVLNTILYRETINENGSYIYINGGEYIIQYSFSNTDIATNENFCNMVNSAAYFSDTHFMVNNS